MELSQIEVLNPIARAIHHPDQLSKIENEPPAKTADGTIQWTPNPKISNSVNESKANPIPAIIAINPILSRNALPLESMLHSRAMLHGPVFPIKYLCFQFLNPMYSTLDESDPMRLALESCLPSMPIRS